MRATFVVVLLAASGARAVADDRAPVLDVEGAFGVVVPNGQSSVEWPMPDPAPLGIARAMVSWEQPPVAMPVERGTADWSAGVGPELAVGFMGNDRRGDAFAQAGLRLNVGFAQNAMGLLQISAKGGLWLAARAGVVGGEHNTMLEGDLGWYLWLGNTGWRVGWEMGGFGVRNPTSNGLAMPLYSDSTQDVTGVVHFAVFVGSQL
jgi:hypothetical protein